MTVQLKDLQDKAKYKKLLKEELTTLKAAPAVFHYFEKFKFDDGKLGPLMLVGDLMRKDLFESVKNTDAPIKARGKCAKAGDEVHFQVELGALPLDKLKADMSNVEAKEVAKLADAGGAAPVDDKALKGAAEAKHVLVTQQFDAIKGRVNDETRKAMRDIFGRIDDAMKAAKYGDALTAMKAAEAACAKAGNELRQGQGTCDRRGLEGVRRAGWKGARQSPSGDDARGRGQAARRRDQGHRPESRWQPAPERVPPRSRRRCSCRPPRRP